jgi:hypothetical protein
MSARPTPFGVHVADQVLAALGGPDSAPLPTRAIEERTGYGTRYGQLVYRILNQLAAAGAVEKINSRRKPVYWRRLTPLPPVPVITVTQPGRKREQS